MKKMLIPLLVLAMLFTGLAALAEEETVTVELNTAKLPVYAPDDPYLNGLTSGENTLPVIVLSARKNLQLQVNVLPRTLKNKKSVLSVDNEEVVRVRGNTVTAMQAGETVLTVASVQDPSATAQYRIVVIQPVTRISLSMPAKSVAIGQSMSLAAAILPEDATRKELTWTSADERIATVDANGVVTGVKRGSVRISAMSTDGAKIRANVNVQVTQSAEEITLDKPEITVDAGRSAMLKATVLPKDTNNKKVVWSSSDESVATVNAQGRITGVAVGDCEIVCTSEEIGSVQAKAVVHVQQPVKKVTLGAAPAVYNGESAQLTWTVEPLDATNQKLRFTSANEKILTVSEDGTVTGVMGGETTVTAVTTDGSNRQARVRVKVMQHLTGVHMLRRTAYIDLGQTSTAGAVLEPEKAKNVNPNMTWESGNTSVAAVKANAKTPNRVEITGVSYGDTEVIGTTEDGGFRTSIVVKVGDWENSLKWKEGKFDARGNFNFVIANTSNLNITRVTLEIEVYDFDGNPMKGINSRNGSNVVKAVYNGQLGPGKTTEGGRWNLIDFDRVLANQEGFAAIVVRISEFEIDHDWVKTIRNNNRQMRIRYDPHHVL